MPGYHGCQNGCFPVDKHWHGGSLKIPPDEIPKFTDMSGPDELSAALGEGIYDGDGAFVIEDIADFKRFVEVCGPDAAESLIRDKHPAGQPYVRGRKDSDDIPLEDQIKCREVSISGIGQGHDMAAYLDAADRIATHYKFDAFKVGDWVRATPKTQVHQELTQRRQQAEQQINRTLGNLSDLYEQKQLLEHDKRQLEERMAHFEAAEEAKQEGEGYEDELKADFVDLVDQHTGRHSILQMQANNIFPSLTADFYSMSGLDDLEDGHLADLPQNEKAVLRKKWKLYQRWKEQFRSGLESKLNDVNRRLRSVEKSIEETEEWLKPYVQDIKQITEDFEGQLGLSQAISRYLPAGMANIYRAMKLVAWKDQSPMDDQDRWYDILLMEPMHFSTGGIENPQAAGQGLTVFNMGWIEFLACKHVHEAVWQEQVEKKQREVEEYIAEYQGKPIETVDSLRSDIKATFNLTDTEAEKLEEAETKEELKSLRGEFWAARKRTSMDRWKNKVKTFFGMTDEFYHPHPMDLKRGLMGPHYPSRFYLDYKYENDLYVMK